MKTYSEIRNQVQYYEDKCDQNIIWSKQDTSVSNKLFFESNARNYRQAAEKLRREMND